jgi:molybdenum cofactor biosynthesis enzyme MoaA
MEAQVPHRPTEYTVDPRFSSHFRDLRQVFLYVNDQCNLSCKQCIYKPHVTYNEDREIGLPAALGLLNTMHSLGARKLTILGGEPTLYGRKSGGTALRALIRGARDAGFDYLRMDTNGHFPPALYEQGGLIELDEIAFSLDGHDSRTNDMLRGLGTFRKITRQISEAVTRGLRATITCCIHTELLDKDPDGITGVEHVIRLGQALGVETVNFHDLFKAGVPMDTWTGDFNTTVEDHLTMYADVKAKILAGMFDVKVRLPQCFVTADEFRRNPEYYGYCPVKLGERVMIHSDGIIRICSNLICTSFGAGYFTDTEIKWNESGSNELRHHDLEAMTPCTNRSKNMKYGQYVPLCFSFKPDQDEPAWNSLDWDSRQSEGESADTPVVASDDMLEATSAAKTSMVR